MSSTYHCIVRSIHSLHCIYVVPWRAQEILAKHNCPYLVRGYFAFRSMHHIYFALEFLPGGDLLAMLRNCGCVPEEMARFYLAEVIRIDR